MQTPGTYLHHTASMVRLPERLPETTGSRSIDIFQCLYRYPCSRFFSKIDNLIDLILYRHSFSKCFEYSKHFMLAHSIKDTVHFSRSRFSVSQKCKFSARNRVTDFGYKIMCSDSLTVSIYTCFSHNKLEYIII